ncbi:hypothetical protein GYMLUDRAFT_179557 [Collybiopsis luxurians FD-317 M1]|uniref:Terpene synthase n=1 Tax=Collybiopsis luxurians FD-317 M1 TaxID=944289 RepID=A0A0D0BTR9_9AGAR|nr:hypothetical protein GYMLUDRAFT_179557 [Collybiopsis luxurians FD-317 M1]
MAYPSYQFPDFFSYCSYALRFNQYEKAVSAETRQWVHRYSEGVIPPSEFQNFDAQKYVWLASTCYPDAGYPQFRVCADFLTYLFHVDDLTDKMDNNGTRGTAEQIMDAFRDPSNTLQNDQFLIGRMSADMLKRMQQTALPRVQQRFIDGVNLFFQAVNKQAQYRQAESIPDLDSYISERRDTGALKPCWALIEYANNLHIPDHILNSPIVREMEDIANDVICYTNDLVSYPVEHSKGHTHNIIPVIMHQNPNMTLVEAVDHVSKVMFEKMDKFNQLKATLLETPLSLNLAVYIEGMENWMIGHAHFAFESERYLGKQGRSIRQTRIISLLAPL